MSYTLNMIKLFFFLIKQPFYKVSHSLDGYTLFMTPSAFSSVQSLSRVRLFATPWIAACQASLSITNSQSLPKLMFIESVMPSSHLILFHPLLLLPPIPPSIRSFPMSRLFEWGGQNIGVSASAPVLPMNTQDRSPLGWTSWISLQSKGLSRVFSNTTVQTHQCFSAQLSSALYPTSFHIILHALVAPNLTDSLSLTNIHNFAHIASVSMFSLHFSSH